MPDAPRYPLGTKCTVVIQDHAGKPLKISARVSHHSQDGVGFTFSNPHIEDCLRLKHIVKPHWDGKDFLEGMLLMLRYSAPATELKDCLSLTSFLSSNPNVFARRPHTPDSCALDK